MGRARKHVMYLFLVDKWGEDFSDLAAAMYAVRARSAADCVEVLCDDFLSGTPEERRDQRELIQQQLAGSRKARLYYRYSTSTIFDMMEYRE